MFEDVLMMLPESLVSILPQVEKYRYFDPETVGLDFEGMLEDIRAAPEGSVILLHGRAFFETEFLPRLPALCSRRPGTPASKAACRNSSSRYLPFTFSALTETTRPAQPSCSSSLRAHTQLCAFLEASKSCLTNWNVSFKMRGGLCAQSHSPQGCSNLPE